MSTSTIYARVSDETKEAADAYATSRDVKLTDALNELLTLGLNASRNSSANEALVTRVAELERALGEAHLATREQIVARERVEQELAAMRQAAQVWSRRADLAVGICPRCRQPVSGNDLLVTGHCSSCQASTSALMEPKDNDVNSRDLMLALGAVGVLLGIIAIAGKK